VRINEVEQLVGVTKGNIRFYEKEGLITPRRNQENGYRDYNEADVEWLKKIRLLRMLDVPIEEILRLKSGELTLEDAMGRHLIQLERKQSNLAVMQGLCAKLRSSRCQLEGLDANEVLDSMERHEQEGKQFMNLMGALLALIVWGFTISPEEAPPVGVVVTVAAVPLVIIVYVLVALYQRIKQIRGGEENAAAQY